MRRSHCLALAIAVLTVASCGASGKPASNAAGTAGAPNTKTSGAPAASPSAGSGGSATKDGSTGGSTPAPGSTSAAKPGAPGGATPRPSASSFDPASHQATAEELPIDAAVTPNCVIPGTPVTLKVKTLPKSTLGFVAVYHGDKSGAAPPWGEGYGGNDKGEANDEGKWSYSWTVRADTPSGPAYVMLVVARNGKQRTINVPFSVGEREVGGCGT